VKTRGEMATYMRGSVARIGVKFDKPDDDWVATLVASGSEGVRVYSLMPDLFEPGATKTGTWRWLPELVKKENVRCLGLVMSTWALKEDERKELRREKGPNASFGDHPNAREQVWIAAIDRVGEEFWIAEIVRREDAPPTLGKWERPDFDTIGGDAVSALRSILRGDS